MPFVYHIPERAVSSKQQFLSVIFLQYHKGYFHLNVEETKTKIASLAYIQNELNGIANVAK